MPTTNENTTIKPEEKEKNGELQAKNSMDMKQAPIPRVDSSPHPAQVLSSLPVLFLNAEKAAIATTVTAGCDTVMAGYKAVAELQRAINRYYVCIRIPDDFDFTELNRELARLTRGKFAELWNQYLSESRVRSFFNAYVCETSSEATAHLQRVASLRESLISDERRAQIVIKYMCKQENWGLGFCAFLWKNYLNNNFALTEDKHADMAPAHTQCKA